MRLWTFRIFTLLHRSCPFAWFSGKVVNKPWFFKQILSPQVRGFSTRRLQEVEVIFFLPQDRKTSKTFVLGFVCLWIYFTRGYIQYVPWEIVVYLLPFCWIEILTWIWVLLQRSVRTSTKSYSSNSGCQRRCCLWSKLGSYRQNISHIPSLLCALIAIPEKQYLRAGPAFLVVVLRFRSSL